MKKRILALSLAAAMVIGALASCTKTAEPASSSVEARDITLTLWGPEQDQEFLKTVAKEWGDKYAADNEDVKSVTVDVQIKGEDNAKTDALNDVEAAADVFGVASDQLSALSAANAIYKIPSAIADEIKSVIGDNTVFQSTYWDGDCYGFPYTDNTAAILYYNKSKLSEDDVKSLNTILEKAKVAAEIGGGWHDMMWAATAGAEVYTKNDKSINTLNKPEVAKVLAWLATQVKDGKMVDATDADNSAAMIGDGQVDAAISGPWAASKFETALGDNYGVVALPTLTVEDAGLTDKQMVCFGGSKMNVINANSKEPEAALSLAQAIMSEDNQIKRFQANKTAPASTSLLSNAEVGSDAKVAAEVAQTANSVVATPLLGTSGYWGAYGGIVDEIANGTLSDVTEIQTKLETAVADMTAALGA